MSVRNSGLLIQPPCLPFCLPSGPVWLSHRGLYLGQLYGKAVNNSDSGGPWLQGLWSQLWQDDIRNLLGSQVHGHEVLSAKSATHLWQAHWKDDSKGNGQWQAEGVEEGPKRLSVNTRWPRMAAPPLTSCNVTNVRRTVVLIRHRYAVLMSPWLPLFYAMNVASIGNSASRTTL